MYSICRKCSKYACLIICLSLIWFIGNSIVTRPKRIRPHVTLINANIFKEKTLFFAGKKYVHLDLKGAPPLTRYYTFFFPFLKSLKVDGLILEYEDMFPYDGQILRDVSALNAYSKADIAFIKNLARKMNLEIIPLVQTFGHLEHVLKLQKFMSLRETIDFPDTICPSNDQSINILSQMLFQVIEAHPYSNFVHIGADEVYHIGLCERCTKRMSDFSLSKNALFLRHINTVSNIVTSRYPNMSILVWDDAFRSMKEEELLSAKLSSKLVPVVWEYKKDVYEELGSSLWELYSKVFPKVWVATSFKGTSGPYKFVPEILDHAENQKSWLKLINEYSELVKVESLILTGWQRYDHFSVLCELLPVSIPSLVMSLKTLEGDAPSVGPFNPPTEVAKILNCEKDYALLGSAFGVPKCDYLGGKILENVVRLKLIKEAFETLNDHNAAIGWMSDFNLMYNFSNPERLSSVILRMNQLKVELEQITKELNVDLTEIYDKYTIDEWMITYVKPLRNKILKMWMARQNILTKDSWPRGPVNFRN